MVLVVEEVERLRELKRIDPALPASCVDLGSVSAFLHETLRFTHGETALLRVSHMRHMAGGTPGAITSAAVDSMATAVRRAYSDYKARLRRRPGRRTSQ